MPVPAPVLGRVLGRVLLTLVQAAQPVPESSSAPLPVPGLVSAPSLPVASVRRQIHWVIGLLRLALLPACWVVRGAHTPMTHRLGSSAGTGRS